MFKTDSDIQNKALLIGEDFPLIKNILGDGLQKKDCRVFFELKNNQFDYILVFGETRKKKQIISQLKNGGKILQIILENHSEKTSFPFFILDLQNATTADVLAKKILKRLFSQRPHLVKIKEPRKRIPKKPFFSPQKIVLMFFAVAIIFPWFFSLATLSLGINNLKAVDNEKISFADKEKRAERANFEINLAKKSGHVLADLLSPVFKKESGIIKESLVILENLGKCSREAVVLEKLAREENINFLKKDNNFKDYGYVQIKSSFENIERNLSLAVISYSKIAPYKDSFLLRRFWQKLAEIPKMQKMISDALELIEVTPEILAFNGQKKYLLLLQNNFELRPTGGFIGSYAVLTFKNGSLHDLKIEDVYVADGQLKGRVEPPKPIATILNQPNWYLRDSNWDPDFLASSTQAEWFLQKETGEKFDGVMAVDLYFISDLLDSLGGVYVPDYQANVDQSNFFYKLQTEYENDFFAGSSKKKDLISALASSIIITLQDKKDISWLTLFSHLYQSLEEKHWLLYLHQKDVQEKIEKLGFGGRILTTNDENADYFMLVEANLGVNKVNFQIERKVEFTLSLNDKEIEKKVKIKIKNKSSELYKNYLRILIPDRANIAWVKLDGRKLDLRQEVNVLNYEDKTSVGLLAETNAGRESVIELLYKMPIKKNADSFRYQFLVQKQPGIETLPFSFQAEKSEFFKIEDENSLSITEDLRKDKLILIDFEKVIK